MSILLAKSKFALVACSILCERWQENFKEEEAASGILNLTTHYCPPSLASFIGGTTVGKKNSLAISCWPCRLIQNIKGLHMSVIKVML